MESAPVELDSGPAARGPAPNRDKKSQQEYLTKIPNENKLKLFPKGMAVHHVLLTASQVGQLLQSARKAAGLSQADLAARLGLGQSRLSKLEQDPGSLTVDQLLRICGALQLDLSVAPKPEGPPATGSEW